MTPPKKTEYDHLCDARSALLSAALPHVVFDGWGAETFRAAVADSQVDEGLARLACPRGGIDLAKAYHVRGDELMVGQLQASDFAARRFRDRITTAVRVRLQAVTGENDVMRRSLTLFAMPQHAAEGTALVWQTCDLIWRSLGDTSEDLNWYTKRATLSAVYSSTVLYWLGDASDQQADTWAFLDRRIENVMQIETLKGKLRKNPLVQGFMKGPGRVLDRIHAPNQSTRTDLPGYLHNSEHEIY